MHCRPIRSLAVFAVVAVAAIFGSPLPAAADGAAAAVITSAGSLLMSSGQVNSANARSKDARRQAEALLAADAAYGAPGFAFVDGAARSPAPLTLADLRVDVLDAVELDGAMAVYSTGDMSAPTPAAERRRAFETLRACWNGFVLVPFSNGGVRELPDCAGSVDSVFGKLGIDANDTQAAFAGAPTLVQQIAAQRVDTNRVENGQRALVVALLALRFLDADARARRFRLIALADGSIVFPPAAGSTSLSHSAAPARLPPPATGCAIGWMEGLCLASPSVLVSAIAGVMEADTCAFARAAWIPPYSRIRNPQPKEPRFGDVPGC